MAPGAITQTPKEIAVAKVTTPADIVIDGTRYRYVLEAPGYAVSRCGVVASNRGRGELEGSDGCLWGFLRPSVANGYLKVNLQVDGSTETHRIHRLVLLVWVGPPPPNKPECRHLDGDKQNNLADNLAWGSSAENSADQAAHGTTTKGSRVGISKLTEQSVRRLRRLAALGVSQNAIAQQLGVSRASIGNVIAGRTWAWLA